jgi:hypothetical protein
VADIYEGRATTGPFTLLAAARQGKARPLLLAVTHFSGLTKWITRYSLLNAMHIIHSGIRFTLLAVCFYILMKDVLHTQQRQFVAVNKVDCVKMRMGRTEISWWVRVKVFHIELLKTGNGRINITSRHVRVTMVAVGRIKYYIFWVYVCSLSYPACNAHEPHYIVIYGLSGCTIFLQIIS